MGRVKFAARRLAQGVIALLLIAVVNFFLIRAAPGDPASVMAGEAGAGDAKFVTQLRQQFGLDKSLPEQLGIYLGHVATLDLGQSYRRQRPVADLIGERVPATLMLTASAFVMSLLFGITLGAWSSSRAGTWADSAVTTVALVFYATPLFWVALMAVLIFSVQLDWLPAFGMTTVGGGFSGFGHALDVIRHLVLPATTLALFYMAIYARMTRTAMLDVSRMDFIKTARAKGVPSGRIWRAHILRNALLPIITLAGIQAGQMVGGAILTETVFAWPGIGRLMFEALLERDYNLLLGVFLFTAAMVVLFNLVTDIVYTLVDPRIELT
ncbi:MAG TPA: ABC transporter permease [Stellaceae bacterium]|nr:ABC transporter permease [Stellaceae bacterium]